MVFSSMNPVFFDQLNGSKQQIVLNNQVQERNIGGNQEPHLHPPPPQLEPQSQPPPSFGHEGGVGGPIRPGSMAERARQAKIPHPEGALKCPRCESMNTKFCYFNNYSLSQPRHFCKTCRRYWTRGGALRNVPVGGGCRRSNKRSKGSNTNIRSKSPFLKGNIQLPPLNLPMLPPLHDLGDYNSTNGGMGLGGIRTLTTLTPGVGGGAEILFGSSNSTNATTTTTSSNNGGLIEQWRLQQYQVPEFSFLANLESPNNHGLYSFEAVNDDHECGNYTGEIRLPSSSSKQLEGQLREVNQYWGSTTTTATTTTNTTNSGINAWIDL